MKTANPKTIILAAGIGSRLKPHTDNKPKCMLEIDGISLIDRQISVLRRNQINEIIIIGGYKIKMLEGKGDRIIENSRYYETNMVSTLFSAEQELNGDVIISYGDIVYSDKVLRSLLDSKSDISVVIDTDWKNYWQARSENPLDDLESLKLDNDFSISEIGQKPNSLDEIEGQYIGLMKFSSNGLKQIKAIYENAKQNDLLGGNALSDAYMIDLLQATINSGAIVNSVFTSGEWVEVDTIIDMNLPLTKARLQAIL